MGNTNQPPDMNIYNQDDTNSSGNIANEMPNMNLYNQSDINSKPEVLKSTTSLNDNITPEKNNSNELAIDPSNDPVQFIGGLGQNALNQLKEMGEGFGAIGGLLGKSAIDAIGMPIYDNGKWGYIPPKSPLENAKNLMDTAMEIGKGTLEHYNNTYIEPIKHGDLGQLGKNLYHKPLDPLLDFPGAGSLAKKGLTGLRELGLNSAKDIIEKGGLEKNIAKANTDLDILSKRLKEQTEFHNKTRADLEGRLEEAEKNNLPGNEGLKDSKIDPIEPEASNSPENQSYKPAPDLSTPTKENIAKNAYKPDQVLNDISNKIKNDNPQYAHIEDDVNQL
ncbi:MAG: hypothetical protein QXL94_02890, partial [Candidatus Parvarchaeum sp.]